MHGSRPPLAEVDVSSDPLQFDVHGATVVVRADDDGWLAESTGHAPDGAGRQRFRIPGWVTIDELPRFLAAVFDDPVAGGRPDVHRIP